MTLRCLPLSLLLLLLRLLSRLVWARSCHTGLSSASALATFSSIQAEATRVESIVTEMQTEIPNTSAAAAGPGSIYA